MLHVKVLLSRPILLLLKKQKLLALKLLLQKCLLVLVHMMLLLRFLKLPLPKVRFPRLMQRNSAHLSLDLLYGSNTTLLRDPLRYRLCERRSLTWLVIGKPTWSSRCSVCAGKER